MTCPPEVALITGCYGNGKLSLVKTIIESDLLREKGFYCITVTFDKLGHSEPLEAMVTAFHQYFDLVARSNAEYINAVRTNIMDKTGDCSGVLIQFFPSLGNFLSNHNTSMRRVQIGVKKVQLHF
eukprot:11294379-Ditylum_brightwellii.AAC.1